MKLFYQYLGVLSLTSLLACSSGTSTNENKDSASIATTEQAQPVAEVALSFADPAQEKVFTAYLALKDKLVATNYAEAKQAAQALSEQLKTSTSFAKALISVEKIAKDKDIAAQRTNFTALNNEIIPVFKTAELTSGTIYVQHCPMANNNDGGDWLAAEKKIQNPYYGDEMLECGSVIEKFTSKK